MWTEVTITAEEAPAGKEFSGWIVNAGGVELADATNATTTFTMWTEDVEVTASYKDITYSITVNQSEHGAVTANVEEAAAWATVTLTVNPEEGYQLVSLTYTVGSEDPVEVEGTSFTMPAWAVTVNATFTAVTYGVTVNQSEHGTVTATVDGNVVSEATAWTEIILTVIPDEWYESDTITVTGGADFHHVSGETDKYSLIMPAGAIIVGATFTAIKFMDPDIWITVSAWSVAGVLLDNVEVTTGFNPNDYTWVDTPQIIIQQKTNNAALTEEWTTESALEDTLTSKFVVDTWKVADMYWILDLKLFYLDWSGNATPLWNVVFSEPVKVKIPVKEWVSRVQVRVKHEWDASYGTSWLTLIAGASCNPDGTVQDDANAYTWWDVDVVDGIAVIYTCSASSFVAYIEEDAPASTPSSNTSWWGGSNGWGGGSSSSYSCKSLPANAVANNTSKPKKDTNYSYSTDTGVVCTFQCKAGYTRNEKDEKCEKSSEAPVDTDKEGTEKVDTTDASDTAFEDLRKVLDDGYNVEFHNAYNFAFKNGITTMPNIQAADMNSPLTRIAMAKMLSKYAINVLKKTPDTTKTISFPDVSAELDAEYNNGVTLAYQLWIMWVNIENFRPDDLVTRAEFVTALSRMLFGLADGENLYYETHMQKLLDENIITVDNPNMHELRGYVMIMLMRSVKNN